MLRTVIGAGVEDGDMKSWRAVAMEVKWTLKGESYCKLGSVSGETWG